MLQAVGQLVDDIFVHALRKGESILVINSPFVAVRLPCIWDMIRGSAMMLPALILILRLNRNINSRSHLLPLPNDLLSPAINYHGSFLRVSFQFIGKNFIFSIKKSLAMGIAIDLEMLSSAP